jgi:2-keto-4-pentenoate hydratase
MTRATAEWILGRLAARPPYLGDMPAELRPADMAEAYAVQDRLAERLTADGAGPAIGWKIGSTTPAMQKLLGVPEPAAGRMHRRSLIEDGTIVPFGRYRRPAVECEIAIRLARPLDARAARLGRDEVAAAIGTLHPAIELVDDRYGDFAAAGAPLMICDNFFHAGLVLGPAAPDWQALDLAALRGTTLVDGVEKLAGRGADVLGHPFNAVVWLAERLARLDRRLERGELITTGSLPLPYWAAAGESIEIRIEGIGGVRLGFSR